MYRRASWRVAGVVLTTFALGACGGGGDDAADIADDIADDVGTDIGSSLDGVDGANPDAASALDASIPDGAGAAGSSEPVDVCALLSPEDGAEVAKASGLGGDANATSTFSVDSAPEPVDPQVVSPLLGACGFDFYYTQAASTDRVFSGRVVIQAQSAEDFELFYTSGTVVPGIGDEAYSQFGATVVRKGGVMLSSGENSMTESFVQAMFAKMAPNLP